MLPAAARGHLRREGAWDEAALGVPICQEDMIGGQTMFSIQVLDALHRLGVHVTGAEADAYLYAWQVVGTMLGIDRAAAPLLLGAPEHLKERSPLAALVLDRLGALTTRFELSSLTRGRVTHYAIPDHLKEEYGVHRPEAERWTPPPVSALLADPEARA